MGQKASAAANSAISRKQSLPSPLAPTGISTPSVEYVVASTVDMRPIAGGSRVGSYAEARQQYDALIAEHPELDGEVQVMSTLEVEAA
jgi:hypothetical protein